MTEWQQTTEHKDVSKRYVRHLDGRRGVYLNEVGNHGDKRIVVCDTGAEEVWSYSVITWLYLIPKEEW